MNSHSVLVVEWLGISISCAVALGSFVYANSLEPTPELEKSRARINAWFHFFWMTGIVAIMLLDLIDPA